MVQLHYCLKPRYGAWKQEHWKWCKSTITIGVILVSENHIGEMVQLHHCLESWYVHENQSTKNGVNPLLPYMSYWCQKTRLVRMVQLHHYITSKYGTQIPKYWKWWIHTILSILCQSPYITMVIFNMVLHNHMYILWLYRNMWPCHCNSCLSVESMWTLVCHSIRHKQF